MTPTPASHLDHLCSAYVNRRYEGSHIPVEIYKQTGILACCGTYCCILSPYHTITFFTSKEKRTRKTPAVVAPPYRCASSSRQDDPSGLSLLAPCSHLSLSLSRYLPACAPNVSSKVVRTARVSHVPSLGEASGARLLFYTISPLLLPVVSDNGRNISISRDRG